MAFIYKITNKINGKVYIGKTEDSITVRFKQHLKEYKKDRSKERPLYRAFRKYGVENFELDIVEITECACEREIYWIEFYKSYSDGYNATKGGDGRSYVDKDLILYHLVNTTKNCSEIARITGYDRMTCSKIAKQNNLYVQSRRIGVDSSSCTINEDIVKKIRELYIPKKFGKRKISALLNISVYIVDDIVRGKSWKHVF